MRGVQAAPGTPLSPAAGVSGTAPARKRRIAVLVGVAVFVLAADIITKAVVVAHLRPDQPVHLLGNVLEFWLTRNPGAAFNVACGTRHSLLAIADSIVSSTSGQWRIGKSALGGALFEISWRC